MFFLTLVCLFLLWRVFNSYLYIAEVNVKLGRSNEDLKFYWSQMIVLGSVSCICGGLTVYLYRKLRKK